MRSLYIFGPLNRDTTPWDGPYRASGWAVCGMCGKLISMHPMDHFQLGWMDIPYLHVMCDGERVHL